MRYFPIVAAALMFIACAPDPSPRSSAPPPAQQKQVAQAAPATVLPSAPNNAPPVAVAPKPAAPPPPTAIPVNQTADPLNGVEGELRPMGTGACELPVDVKFSNGQLHSQELKTPLAYRVLSPNSVEVRLGSKVLVYELSISDNDIGLTVQPKGQDTGQFCGYRRTGNVVQQQPAGVTKPQPTPVSTVVVSAVSGDVFARLVGRYWNAAASCRNVPTYFRFYDSTEVEINFYGRTSYSRIPNTTNQFSLVAGPIKPVYEIVSFTNTEMTLKETDGRTCQYTRADTAPQRR